MNEKNAELLEMDIGLLYVHFKTKACHARPLSDEKVHYFIFPLLARVGRE